MTHEIAFRYFPWRISIIRRTNIIIYWIIITMRIAPSRNNCFIKLSIMVYFLKVHFLKLWFCFLINSYKSWSSVTFVSNPLCLWMASSNRNNSFFNWLAYFQPMTESFKWLFFIENITDSALFNIVWLRVNFSKRSLWCLIKVRDFIWQRWI